MGGFRFLNDVNFNFILPKFLKLTRAMKNKNPLPTKNAEKHEI